MRICVSSRSGCQPVSARDEDATSGTVHESQMYSRCGELGGVVRVERFSRYDLPTWMRVSMWSPVRMVHIRVL
jgi:hypothetical protein